MTVFAGSLPESKGLYMVGSVVPVVSGINLCDASWDHAALDPKELGKGNHRRRLWSDGVECHTTELFIKPS